MFLITWIPNTLILILECCDVPIAPTPHAPEDREVNTLVTILIVIDSRISETRNNMYSELHNDSCSRDGEVYGSDLLDLALIL